LQQQGDFRRLANDAIGEVTNWGRRVASGPLVNYSQLAQGHPSADNNHEFQRKEQMALLYWESIY
jgi:hypothetical protein